MRVSTCFALVLLYYLYMSVNYDIRNEVMNQSTIISDNCLCVCPLYLFIFVLLLFINYTKSVQFNIQCFFA